jgi:hypothetical protein
LDGLCRASSGRKAERRLRSGPSPAERASSYSERSARPSIRLVSPVRLVVAACRFGLALLVDGLGIRLHHGGHRRAASLELRPERALEATRASSLTAGLPILPAWFRGRLRRILSFVLGPGDQGQGDPFPRHGPGFGLDADDLKAENILVRRGGAPVPGGIPEEEGCVEADGEDGGPIDADGPTGLEAIVHGAEEHRPSISVWDLCRHGALERRRAGERPRTSSVRTKRAQRNVLAPASRAVHF